MSKMMNHCGGTVQMREESESGISKWEEIRFNASAKDGERGDSSDVRWKTVPQTSGCDRMFTITSDVTWPEPET